MKTWKSISLLACLMAVAMVQAAQPTKAARDSEKAAPIILHVPGMV